MSSTYPVPGSERDYTAPRYPDLRLRLVPNESSVTYWPHLGELVQNLVDLGTDVGISVELDTSDRTRPGEMRGGASPMAVVALAVLSGSVGAVTDQLLAATVAWVRRHKRETPDHADDFDEEMVVVKLYGPDGKVIKAIQIRGDVEEDASSRYADS